VPVKIPTTTILSSLIRLNKLEEEKGSYSLLILWVANVRDVTTKRIFLRWNSITKILRPSFSNLILDLYQIGDGKQSKTKQKSAYSSAPTVMLRNTILTA
jgi:hypothetical protein